VPTFSGISHTSFSVRDADRSAAWWRDVFGLVQIDRVSGPGWRGVVMLHRPSATVLEVQQHDRNPDERFDPARIGLDHLGFKVDDRAQLDEWQAYFAEHGIDHTPIVEEHYGSVLTFRDPDGIQFELFHRPDHP
jgi:glyoxylase I family protein